MSKPSNVGPAVETMNDQPLLMANSFSGQSIQLSTLSLTTQNRQDEELEQTSYQHLSSPSSSTSASSSSSSSSYSPLQSPIQPFISEEEIHPNFIAENDPSSAPSPRSSSSSRLIPPSASASYCKTSCWNPYYCCCIFTYATCCQHVCGDGSQLVIQPILPSDRYSYPVLEEGQSGCEKCLSNCCNVRAKIIAQGSDECPLVARIKLHFRPTGCITSTCYSGATDPIPQELFAATTLTPQELAPYWQQLHHLLNQRKSHLATFCECLCPCSRSEEEAEEDCVALEEARNQRHIANIEEWISRMNSQLLRSKNMFVKLQFTRCLINGDNIEDGEYYLAFALTWVDSSDLQKEDSFQTQRIFRRGYQKGPLWYQVCCEILGGIIC